MRKERSLGDLKDKPWKRPGSWAYGLQRLRNAIRPPVTVRPVPDALVIQRNVAVPMRDGTILRVNIYRPAGVEPVPTLLCAHPYGKDKVPQKTRRGGWALGLQYHIMNHSEPLTISNETTWEAPDPAWWAERGYAVVNADLRGFGTSEGVGELFSTQEGDDVHDIIEWIADQGWCTGNVGMLGVSYLAMSQYFTAASHPPSLKAICPWEGFTDIYRDFMTPGGVKERGFSSIWGRTAARIGRLRTNLDAERNNHPLRDAWWKEHVPALANIDVPLLVCASFSDANVHSVGSFRLFTNTGSSEKFAYTHRGPKWARFYSNEALSVQKAFFDRYLRNTDVLAPPAVRLEVSETRTKIAEVRDEAEWPLARTMWRELSLTTRGRLEEPPRAGGNVTFNLRKTGLLFSYVFPSDTEITGTISLRLWVSLPDTTDAHLFVGVEKWRGRRYIPFETSYGYGRGRIAIGMQRVALRANIDTSSRLAADPPYDTERPLTPGEVVPVDMTLSPSSTLFRAGETLKLVVAGRYLEGRNPLSGHFPARYQPSTKGHCTIHMGENHASTLYLPVIPPTTNN